MRLQSLNLFSLFPKPCTSPSILHESPAFCRTAVSTANCMSRPSAMIGEHAAGEASLAVRMKSSLQSSKRNRQRKFPHKRGNGFRMRTCTKVNHWPGKLKSTCRSFKTNSDTRHTFPDNFPRDSHAKHKSQLATMDANQKRSLFTQAWRGQVSRCFTDKCQNDVRCLHVHIHVHTHMYDVVV